ncbi:hypothetical protein SKAU_G00105090 [Synaphobranchus kaupii]|uniref:Uncharacterized protein n=1 Tax=Synaphobranchus kaupii TaxID=118154 RepID=A0A9Q1FZB9_SYNKA|nr:hypothetical protein SKAU_G00105090 [Synaphobranchus kaupii]
MICCRADSAQHTPGVHPPIRGSSRYATPDTTQPFSTGRRGTDRQTGLLCSGCTILGGVSQKLPLTFRRVDERTAWRARDGRPPLIQRRRQLPSPIAPTVGSEVLIFLFATKLPLNYAELRTLFQWPWPPPSSNSISKSSFPNQRWSDARSAQRRIAWVSDEALHDRTPQLTMAAFARTAENAAEMPASGKYICHELP